MAEKSNFDAQLERMNYLMNYGKKEPIRESKNIEYYTTGSDGKVYGIIREGQTYYIKTAEQGKEKMLESYEYIGGFNYRNEHGYRSYNEATKQLELGLMKLNESRKVKKDVSTVNFNKSRENMQSLTEEARKELDRVHAIFENSGKIGKYTIDNPESKGTATDPEKQGDPFKEPTKAELDKDMEKTGTVKDATDNVDVTGVEDDLKSDKMKTKKPATGEAGKDAHSDLDGTNVAEQKPKGGKVVKVNESIDGTDLVGFDDDSDIEDIEIDDTMDPNLTQGDGMEEEPIVDNNVVDDTTITAPVDNSSVPVENNDDEYDDLDSLLEELENEFGMNDSDSDSSDDSDTINENEEVIAGDDKVLMGKTVDAKSVAIEDSPVKQNLKTCSDKVCGEKVLDGSCTCDNHQPISITKENYKKMCESVDKIIDSVCDKLMAESKQKDGKAQMQKKVNKLVKEELNTWGKHPKYRKEPMTTPQNKEVIVNDGDKDWNDDSTKGNQAYGEKIGDSAPYQELVNEVMKSITEQLKQKKK